MLAELEEAVNMNGLREDLPSFFAFIRRRDIIGQMEMLADQPGASGGAPLLICGFFRLDDAASSQLTLLAMGNMMRTLEEQGLSAQYVTFARDVFNNSRYNKLTAACGVPEGFSCIGALAAGRAAVKSEYADKHTIFSYIQ